MNLYKFSPIKDEAKLDEVYNYIAIQLDRLSNQLFSQSLPITTLKVFPHYPEEYEYLHSLISEKGPAAPFNSETSFYVEVNEKIESNEIKYLGIRIVDPYRMQVGCGDYEIENFEEFKKKCLGTTPYIRELKKDMLEIWHPDFDILGYIIPKS